MSYKNIYIDTETCGLYGLPVLIQYAEENEEIILYDIWKHSVKETKELIEYFCKNIVIGFNLCFDWFQLSKLYTIWSLLPDEWIPEEHIQEIALKEQKGCDRQCIKPYSCLDLMIHTQRNEYQSLMAREEIRIDKIPIPLAQPLADELEKRVELDGIYFSKRANPDAPKWTVLNRVSKTGIVDTEFQDVVLKFKPSSGLKYLAEYVLKLDPKYHLEDVEVPKEYWPYELGYAPIATYISQPPSWILEVKNKKVKTWPAVIHHHIDHWANNKAAREYAYLDVVYTRELYKYFDKPQHGDIDSILTCMVASVRWHGFQYNKTGILKLKEKATEIVKKSPLNINQHRKVYAYLEEVLDDTEVTGTIELEGCKKPILEGISEWFLDEDEPCLKCMGIDDECTKCNGTGIIKAGIHPAAVRAKELLEIKIANKEIELYDKLLTADRFHASFKIVGTLSSRMAGADNLNPQGIKKDNNVRAQFPLFWDGMILCGGDFESFEVTIADAVFNDGMLHQTLLEGKKFHGLLGEELFSNHTYEEILASDGTDVDLYKKSKNGTFGFLYGGNANTWHKRLGVRLEQAERAYEVLCHKYAGIGESRKQVENDFGSMSQPDGIGSKVLWREPKDYCETFLGFKRYFTLENKICKALYDLAQNPPKEWRKYHHQVIRKEHKGKQTMYGAVSSALYGAAFQIQAANTRAANNHLIQSPGAEITKAVQKAIWDLQPYGANEMIVAPMNIHDEIMCVTNPDYINKVAEVVKKEVEYFRNYVPLIGIEWYTKMANWSDKHDNPNLLRFSYK